MVHKQQRPTVTLWELIAAQDPDFFAESLHVAYQFSNGRKVKEPMDRPYDGINTDTSEHDTNNQ